MLTPPSFGFRFEHPQAALIRHRPPMQGTRPRGALDTDRARATRKSTANAPLGRPESERCKVTAEDLAASAARWAALERSIAARRAQPWASAIWGKKRVTPRIVKPSVAALDGIWEANRRDRNR